MELLYPWLGDLNTIEAVDDDRRSPEERTLRAKICLHHREHRGVLKELAEIPEIVALEADGN